MDQPVTDDLISSLRSVVRSYFNQSHFAVIYRESTDNAASSIAAHNTFYEEAGHKLGKSTHMQLAVRKSCDCMTWVPWYKAFIVHVTAEQVSVFLTVCSHQFQKYS